MGTYLVTLLAGGLGLGIWYGSLVLTGKAFVILGWSVGAIIGVGARISSPQSGGEKAGIIAVVVAALTILAGNGLATTTMVKNLSKEIAEEINDAAYKQYVNLLSNVSK